MEINECKVKEVLDKIKEDLTSAYTQLNNNKYTDMHIGDAMARVETLIDIIDWK